MPHALTILCGLALTATAGAAVAPTPAPATPATTRETTIRCIAAWARATTPTAPAGAVYLTLSNPSDQERQLTGAQTDVCDHCTLHRHQVDAHGRMTMEDCTSFVIPAHGQLVLRPGERHLMLLDLHHGLVRGSHFAMTLRCGTHTLPVEVTVASAAADGPDG